MQNLLPLLFKQENRTPPNQKFSYDLSMQMKQIYPKKQVQIIPLRCLIKLQHKKKVMRIAHMGFQPTIPPTDLCACASDG